MVCLNFNEDAGRLANAGCAIEIAKFLSTEIDDIGCIDIADAEI